MPHIKDRTIEGFDDYFPHRKKRYILEHIQYWLKLVANYYTREITD
jgi:hypothetical protein